MHAGSARLRPRARPRRDCVRVAPGRPDHARPFAAVTAAPPSSRATAGIPTPRALLVGAVAAQRFGTREVFVGAILVALVGDVAEHPAAIVMAARNTMGR
jgi:hypothetical protein